MEIEVEILIALEMSLMLTTFPLLLVTVSIHINKDHTPMILHHQCLYHNFPTIHSIYNIISLIVSNIFHVAKDALCTNVLWASF